MRLPSEVLLLNVKSDDGGKNKQQFIHPLPSPLKIGWKYILKYQLYWSKRNQGLESQRLNRAEAIWQRLMDNVDTNKNITLKEYNTLVSCLCVYGHSQTISLELQMDRNVFKQCIESYCKLLTDGCDG